MRKGQKKLHRVVYPVFWPQRVLETIGRFTYRSIFWLITLPVKILIRLIQLIKLVKIFPLSSFLLILLFLFYWFILRGLPRPNDLVDHRPTLSTKIYDRNNTLLFTFYKDQNRTLVSLTDIPEHFKLATLAIEDSNFYNHNGVSFRGIARSVKQIVLSQELQGGSTITQQLVKNALLTPERTLTRKLKELILSLEVEWRFNKDQILEMYFNQVSYGGTAYGAEQAAQTYFGKSIKEVNLAEAALLAGLPASPTTYSPFGPNPYLAVYRQHQVLNRMVQTQMVAPQEAALAKQQKIKLAPQYTNIKAPHFVMYVKNLLAAELGESMVEQGGLTVTTSLDWNLQQEIQTIVSEEIAKVAQYRITNGAALVTNPRSNEVLAMVGSRDYWDTDRDGQVNVTTRPRQPGSAIKPVNYSLALQTGLTAASIIDDSPVTYDIPGAKPYTPVNYDGRWHGRVTIRQALANSYNVPAVKVLATYGVDKMITQGKNLGITTWNEPSRYGLSLTLGGAEVTMADLAVVYGTLANQGEKQPLRPILAVTDSQGKLLKNFDRQAETVLDPRIAFIITDILADPAARSAAFGTRSYLNIPGHQVAVKTGTTNDKRDNWTIGYTADRLAAVWVGNNDNTPMSQVASGITGASPIWNKIMLLMLKNQPEHKFTKPDGLIELPVCTLTGQLACNGCPSRTEYFLPGTEPKIACKPEYIQQLLEQKQQDAQNRDQILTGESVSQ